MEGDEWNTTADSPAKRKLGYELLTRLHSAFAPGGGRLCGEGKWYPGEPVPRWSYTVFWRKDGAPVWNGNEWLADPQSNNGHTVDDARKIGSEVARLLGVTPEHLKTGLEDAFYYAWKEGTLPTNIDPYETDINDPAERKFMAELFARGLEVPTGFALPVHWNEAEGEWESSSWDFRRAEMFLIPGSSPMGFRLPLESLPWVAKEKRPLPIERSPMSNHEPPLGDFQARFAMNRPSDADSGTFDHHPQQQEAVDEAIVNESKEHISHTAMCFEAREGRVHVFMPPANLLEHYLDLLAAVNAAARNLKIPVVLEGYAPPFDNRLQRVNVTPDPGVIEVNVHPSSSWQEAKAISERLHEEARLTRLGTEKFMLDGRHTGTGGGNHVTLGGHSTIGQPVPTTPGLTTQLAHILATPSRAFLLIFRIVHWPNQPGPSSR